MGMEVLEPKVYLQRNLARRHPGANRDPAALPRHAVVPAKAGIQCLCQARVTGFRAPILRIAPRTAGRCVSRIARHFDRPGPPAITRVPDSPYSLPRTGTAMRQIGASAFR